MYICIFTSLSSESSTVAAKEKRGDRHGVWKKRVIQYVTVLVQRAKIDMSRKLSIYLYRPEWKLAFKSQK